MQIILAAAWGTASLVELFDYVLAPPRDVVSIEALLAPIFECLVSVRSSL